VKFGKEEEEEGEGEGDEGEGEEQEGEGEELEGEELGPCFPPSPFLISANKLLKGPVILNVGGKK
jgi:hypothetical protein